MEAFQGMLLAGDIGATKTALALYEGWPGKQIRHQRFHNAEFGEFSTLLATFLSDAHIEHLTACFGVAGPVLGNQVHMTNLNWLLDAEQLRKDFGFAQVYLINDLVATSVGALQLPEHDFLVLNRGQVPPGPAVRAVLAPGSGLGEGFLVPHGDSFLPCASEGGHASFAPRNQLQDELLLFLRSRQGHVSVEQVCSGLAVPHLFAFMTHRLPAPSWLTEQLQEHVDKTPVILGAGIRSMQGITPCEVAQQTLQLFLDILADEAANLVLKTLAFGGLYLGGGLAARLESCISPKDFMHVFARGTYHERLAQVPIRIILNQGAALLGAAAYGAGAVIR